MDNCPFCGFEEKPFSSRASDHCHWVGEFAGRLANVRSIYCYERELATSRDYLTRLFQSVAPQCIPGEKLIYLCIQIDNYIAGQNIELATLRELLMEKGEMKFTATFNDEWEEED